MSSKRPDADQDRPGYDASSSLLGEVAWVAADELTDGTIGQNADVVLLVVGYIIPIVAVGLPGPCPITPTTHEQTAAAAPTSAHIRQPALRCGVG